MKRLTITIEDDSITSNNKKLEIGDILDNGEVELSITDIITKSSESTYLNNRDIIAIRNHMDYLIKQYAKNDKYSKPL